MELAFIFIISSLTGLTGLTGLTWFMMGEGRGVGYPEVNGYGVGELASTSDEGNRCC